MAQITCENLAAGYEGHPVVSGLDFRVDKGDYLCIVGENGSGKTTLMRTILGLQKPVLGKLLFGDGLRANGIGYLPQQASLQEDFPASVREVVLSGCQARLGRRPFYSKADKALAKQNMERMGIGALAGRCWRELSGGQQQRVLLARALCATRELLFLDEPVAGLDPRVTEDMYALIASLHREGTTILMVTHDLPAAMRYATHILHIGEPVFFGTREAYLENPAFLRFREGKGGDPA